MNDRLKSQLLELNQLPTTQFCTQSHAHIRSQCERKHFTLSVAMKRYRVQRVIGERAVVC